MPVNQHNSIEEAFQALTDIEIVNDENNYPVAEIKVNGVGTIKITMLSEYHYYYILEPLREKILNYYINRLAQEKNILKGEELLDNIKSVFNQIETCKTKEDVIKKAHELSPIFKDKEARFEFFKSLIEMEIIPIDYLEKFKTKSIFKKKRIIDIEKAWDDWQRKIKPTDPLCMFIYLWLFNFDGVKKKVLCLLEKIGAVIQQQSFTDWNNSDTWESYKQQLKEGHERIQEKLLNNSNN